MIASDLPESGSYPSSLDMARVLVTYMTDARAVRQRIREDFDQAPAIITIERLRANYLAARNAPQEPSYKPHEGYYPAEVSRNAEEASKLFLERLERERAYSVARAKREGALDSPALRHPEIVDRLWESEVEKAWRENGELRL